MKKPYHPIYGARMCIALIFFCLCTAVACPQERGSDIVNRVQHICFEFGQSETTIRDSLAGLTAHNVDSIVIEGWASPEGGRKLNSRLARKRQEALRRILVDANIATPEAIRMGPAGVAWAELENLLREENPPYAADILAIMADRPEPGVWDTRTKRMMDHDLGRTWNKMLGTYFPRLRRASATIYITERVAVPQVCAPSPEAAPALRPDTEYEWKESIAVADTLAGVARPEGGHVGKDFYMSLSTNMLYDLAALPNIAAEFYLGKRFSVMASWMYGWWDSKTRNRFWRAYGGYIAGRYWFGTLAGKKPLTGHHAGIYLQALLYDFEWGGKGYLSGTVRHNIFEHPTSGAGVEYGFALPVSEHLNIDFNVGLGYLGGRYYEYEPNDGHYVWLRTRHRNWFGPTKLEVSLIWLLGHGNINRKGGAE